MVILASLAACGGSAPAVGEYVLFDVAVTGTADILQEDPGHVGVEARLVLAPGGTIADPEDLVVTFSNADGDFPAPYSHEDSLGNHGTYVLSLADAPWRPDWTLKLEDVRGNTILDDYPLAGVDWFDIDLSPDPITGGADPTGFITWTPSGDPSVIAVALLDDYADAGSPWTSPTSDDDGWEPLPEQALPASVGPDTVYRYRVSRDRIDMNVLPGVLSQRVTLWRGLLSSSF